MNINHAISLLETGYTTCKVSFGLASPMTYTYKVRVQDEIKQDDHVVVLTANGLRVVRVIEVHDEPKIDIASDIEYKWIVQKVDMTAFDNIMAEEERIANVLRDVEKRKIRQQAREQLAAWIGDEFDKLSIDVSK